MVRAAGPGTIHFVICNNRLGLLMIDHGAGLWTSYYHINIDSTIATMDGKPVAAGTRLGTTGTNTPCGGSAPSPLRSDRKCT